MTYRTYGVLPYNFDELLNYAIGAGTTKSVPSYPPHDIVRITEDGNTHFVLSLAVAAIPKEMIDITVDDGILTIAHTPEKDELPETHQLIHRGISRKSFKLAYKLPDHAKVTSAKYADGLLQIRVDIEIPEEQKPKKIQIDF